MSLIIVVFGVLAYSQLPLREYPDVDTPVVSINTNYQGAAAKVVETRITQLIEDQVAGIEGIDAVTSRSRDGRSSVNVEFGPQRDIDGAANDVRDRVSRILDRLPEEADPPEVVKVNTGERPIMWLNLASSSMSTMELTDYAERYLVDKFSSLDGVARVWVGGQRRYAMRVWMDPARLAARRLTVSDVEAALRRENLELPAGRVESTRREFAVRVDRPYATAEDFRRLVITEGPDGYLIRLGDVAEVEIGPADLRTAFRRNGEPMVGLGIVKQSTANTLAVARLTKEQATRVNQSLPPGTHLHPSYDSSIFIEGAINEVYFTLAIAVLLVAVVIYLFLGSLRATLIPVVTVPLALVGSCIALWVLGFSINLLTLLAMVLAIGLVVDDTIVVVENIARRIEEGEPPLLAAFRGTREVGFAVIATTLVLLAVFAPLTFLEGSTGKLFVEFALELAAAVSFSTFTALTLAPVMASLLLRKVRPSAFNRRFMAGINRMRRSYGSLLGRLLPRSGWVLAGATLVFAIGLSLWWVLPREFAPREDRGAFFVRVIAPEGTGLQPMLEYMDELERVLVGLVEEGVAQRILVRVPGHFGSTASVNSAMGIIMLQHWDHRDRSTDEVMAEVRAQLDDHPGFRAFAFMPQGMGRRFGRPVAVVLGGPTFEELARWRDMLRERLADDPRFIGLDFDYKETKPQLVVEVDTERAADLGVSYLETARTLETLFASRRVTTFERDGEEYDVILEAAPQGKDSPADLTNVYVRTGDRGGLVPLASMVKVRDDADAPELNRYNRQRAITLEADLASGFSLGAALETIEEKVREALPAVATIDYKGESREYQESTATLFFILLAALLIVFLVLAAQFESWLQPFVIMLTVPLAVVGALVGLAAFGNSLNIFSQIGLVMLIGLAAKNGILVVEFANQLRDRGLEFEEALRAAAMTRLRPILMTGLSTSIGALPLVISFGPGAETRLTLGLVVLFGVMSATLAAILVVPAAYRSMARRTGSPGRVAARLEELQRKVEPIRSPDLEHSERKERALF
jgi:multidrug efflux pump